MDDNKTNDGGNQSPSSPLQPVTIFNNTQNTDTNVPATSPEPEVVSSPPPAEETPVDLTPEILPNDQTLPAEENLQVEEVAPHVTTSDDAMSHAPMPLPDMGGEPPAFLGGDNKMKFFMIGGGVLFFIIIFVFIIKLLTGGKAAGTKTTLTYWGLWEDKQIMDPLIQEYEAKNPTIVINYEKMDPTDYREKLLARSQNGQGPDIFRFHNTWLPEITDVVTPLPSSIMTNAQYESTFYPIQAKDLKIGNNYYGIPLQIDSLVLVYNDNLFKKAGIASAPTTWDEVLDDVSRLSIKDSNKNLITSGIALGTASNISHFSDILGLMLLQNGGDLKHLDSDEAAQALEIYRKFAEPPTDYWNDSMPDAITAFAQEKVAMIIVPTWEVLSVKAMNPDIKLKITSIPNVPGAKPISLATYWVEGVSRYSKNQTEAWKFLAFLSSKESETKLFEAQSRTRVFGEASSRRDLASNLTNNEYLSTVINQADNLYTLPLMGQTHDNGLNDEIIKYLLDAVNSTEQGVSYQSAMQTAQQGVSSVLTKYKIQ